MSVTLNFLLCLYLENWETEDYVRDIMQGSAQCRACLQRSSRPPDIQGRWEELRTRPRMTRVSRDLAETISTVWIRLEYERQRQHLSLGRLSQQSHECQRSSLEDGWAQRRIKLEFDASWTVSLKVHVENKTLFVLLFCFPALSRVKISWVPSSRREMEKVQRMERRRFGGASRLGSPPGCTGPMRQTHLVWMLN